MRAMSYHAMYAKVRRSVTSKAKHRLGTVIRACDWSMLCFAYNTLTRFVITNATRVDDEVSSFMLSLYGMRVVDDMAEGTIGWSLPWPGWHSWAARRG